MGWGVGRLMANAIFNFHFDFPHTSLIQKYLTLNRQVIHSHDLVFRLRENILRSPSMIKICDFHKYISLSVMKVSMKFCILKIFCLKFPYWESFAFTFCDDDIWLSLSLLEKGIHFHSPSRRCFAFPVPNKSCPLLN